MPRQKKSEFAQNEIIKKPKKRGRPRKKEVTEIKDIHPVETPIVERSYIFAVGRRKEAVARVRYYPKMEKEIIINAKKYSEYFPSLSLQKIILTPLELTSFSSGKIWIKVRGGGKKGQAESVRLGIARVLEKFDSNLRKILKRAGLLKRDARVKERKKYGLKRARRAPQWQKR